MHIVRSGTLLGTLALVMACAPPPQPVAERAQAAAVATPLDEEQLIVDIRTLAHDTMEGRQTGTPGNERARRYLRERFAETGIEPIGSSFEHRFTFTPRNGTEQLEGVNFIGVVRGTHLPERYIVVTAHYDHLGIRDGEIYNGADDNASGSSALLAMARHFAEQPPQHSIIFAGLDAEEMGLQGARAFVANPPVAHDALLFNVNMDMISRNEADELYAAGTYHYPWLVPLIERLAADAPVTLLMGHDRPDLPPGDDWTQSSDHGPFHTAGIPFLYFGVEDHPDYHRPTDTFENIDPDFFARAAETVRRTIRALDDDPELVARRP
jgi:Zn-dependent M28 family amino/carboxypeptidase